MSGPSRLTLSHKYPLGGNVWAFTFEPDIPLQWRAGQAIRVELPHENPDEAGTKRYFTITSAPYEREVTITTRLTDSTFKQALAKLPVGAILTLLDQPAGTFTWPIDTQRLPVFIAQGIGVTPFISLLRQREHDNQPLAATLVHANLTAPIPFELELGQFVARHPELTIHFETEPTTADRLINLIPKLPNAWVLVSGPRPLLELLGPPVNLPAARHNFDQFTGYSTITY